MSLGFSAASAFQDSRSGTRGRSLVLGVGDGYASVRPYSWAASGS